MKEGKKHRCHLSLPSWAEEKLEQDCFHGGTASSHNVFLATSVGRSRGHTVTLFSQHPHIEHQVLSLLCRSEESPVKNEGLRRWEKTPPHANLLRRIFTASLTDIRDTLHTRVLSCKDVHSLSSAASHHQEDVLEHPERQGFCDLYFTILKASPGPCDIPDCGCRLAMQNGEGGHEN